MDETDTRDVWKRADAVCLDVDSTVTMEDGIDELSKFCGKGEEIANLTKNAMSGTIDFRTSLSMRLDILKPTMQQVRDYVRQKPAKITPGIRTLINCLRQRGTEVYLVSGGFRGIIEPIALDFNIPLQNIFANKLKFFLNGEYAGFDETELTSKTGGKAEVIKILKEKFGFTRVVMIGDGITDLEAYPSADAFIGYGGNVVREEVKKQCKWFVTNFDELTAALCY